MALDQPLASGRNPITGAALTPGEIEHGLLFLSDEAQPLSACELLEWQSRVASGASSARSGQRAPAPAGGLQDPQGRPA